MDTPTPNVGSGLPAEALAKAGMSMRTKILLVVGILLIAVSAVVYFGPRYGIDIGRFFAAGPISSTPPTTDTVKLYPVFDQANSRVQFVLTTATYEITGFQFKASIEGAAFTNIGGFVVSSVLSYPVLPAVFSVGDTVLSYAAGVSGGTVLGLTSTATVATIDYVQPANQTATEVCVAMDMAYTIVTARGVIGASVLDMNPADWNRVCFPVVVATATPAPLIGTFTATPASITSGGASVLSWTVAGATSVSIDNGVGVVSGTSVSVNPATTITYTLTATGPGGTATAVTTVTVAQAAIRGDVNGDRVVDIMDFNLVVVNFGKVPSSAILGDANGDGTINILDFNIVVTFFGTVTPF